VHEFAKVTDGDAGMGPGDAPGAAGKKASSTAGNKRIRSSSPSSGSEASGDDPVSVGKLASRTAGKKRIRSSSPSSGSVVRAQLYIAGVYEPCAD
jgi:hypothetical protein